MSTRPEYEHELGELVWVGSYTADSGHDGEGIGALRVRGVLAAAEADRAPSAPTTSSEGDPGLQWLGTAIAIPSPSFLATHPTLPVVYAVGERAQTVGAYMRVAEYALEPFGETWPSGAAACHVAVDPAGRFIIVSCWNDGKLVLYDLDDSGAIVSRFEDATASDPYAEQAALAVTTAKAAEAGFAPRTSRAHSSIVIPDGRIVSTDLGFDLVRVWQYRPTAENPEASPGAAAGSRLVLDHEIVLPFWSGPRHVALHPSGALLVLTEYSVEVVTIAPAENVRAYGPSGLPLLQITSTSSAVSAPIEPFDAAAEISLSGDARFAYVTVRGSNRLSTMSVDDRGAVHPVADVSTCGVKPRHHVVLGTRLLVAHTESNDVALFELDPATGIPSPTGRLTVAAPTALVAA
ncbi:lactonase family protein [Subtercola sp. PAMC28395]|uniref:lactonase family protein n=1 Tax=Subtercola sp. PAMC28395 TaxID=2846775 RepID=UPI001C0DA8AC|nr:beta-propeller fold lactonase family protein [Subtercola sp. PAMC28395]QWT24601.1 lactonase family protein [Subtercola sp. PAMC28395]